jgi:hypothetical protein
MPWFKKKVDPISDRARVLNNQIAELESQIKRLDSRLQRKQPQPRLRSTALPHGATLTHNSNGTLQHGNQTASSDSAPGAVQDPIFEEVNQNRLKGKTEAPTTPEHYNELGVRKCDLAALFGRLKNHFRGPSTTNPKLVSYLAAGGIQGLRPMRYEKRVARNRFIALVIFLFLMLLGIITAFVRHR